MNFFQSQDKAKQKTKVLILVYLLVLLFLTLLSSLVLLFLVPLAIGQPVPALQWRSIFSSQHWPMFLGVGAFIIGGAFISSYIKSRHLAQGGAVVAASLGGVKITQNSRDLNERKLLNVVEEMAIASGMPVPEVFLLKQESGINAFAAGQLPMDAVIGVTQGCIDQLDRTQLQGVIGHEFSHILNGDMRLNLRLIMLLHGIEFIGALGRILTASQGRSRYRRRRSRGKGAGVAVLAGIALRLIGWFGVFFGRIIQAAVSRQREFLADASAVQFTRDPSSIAGALKVIGYGSHRSRLTKTDVNEVSHLFFGQSFVTHFSMLLATHPPIEQRIKNIEPHWDGEFVPPLPTPNRATTSDATAKEDNGTIQSSATESASPLDALPEPLAMLMAAGVMLDQLNTQQQTQLTHLVEQTGEPMEAMALILAIFIVGEIPAHHTNSQASKTLEKRLKAVKIKGLSGLIKQKIAVLKNAKLHHNAQLLLPLVEMAIPALKDMSKPQYIQFKALLENVIMWDEHKSVFEQSLFLLVTRYLDVHFGLAQAKQVKYRKAKQVEIELQLLFSCLVDYGHNRQTTQDIILDQAYQQAMRHLGFHDSKRLDLDTLAKDKQEIESLFNRAVEKCVHCALSLKHKIVEAIQLTIAFDGEVNATEKELALAIAATMDAPLPRLK